MPLRCCEAKDARSINPALLRRVLRSLSPICWPLPVFSGFLPFLSLGFHNFFDVDCNLCLTSHRSFRMDLAYYFEAWCHANIKEKAAKEEWAGEAEKE